jgi:hypothetical protein
VSPTRRRAGPSLSLARGLPSPRSEKCACALNPIHLPSHVQFHGHLSIGKIARKHDCPSLREAIMVETYPSNLSIDLESLAHLTRGERIACAARYARIALRLLDKLDFPVTDSERAAMEEALILAADSVLDEVSPELLEIALHATGRLADVFLTRCRQRSELALGHIAHAVRAAVRTALTGLWEHARDAMDYTLEAARSTGVWTLEELAGEEARSIRADAWSVDPRQFHLSPTRRREPTLSSGADRSE